MASSSPLVVDLTENFFTCSVCLDQFKEPKLLPCLHRYCRDCLKEIIQASTEYWTFKCPVCNKTCDIPTDGVDGFKTDFHMKSMLEFIQLRKSFESKDLKQCGSCSKTLRISVYCLKCREFLCDHCCQSHKNNRLFKDHKQHIVSLENLENQNFLLEKLSTLTENPRCHHHFEHEAHLCCSSCGNLPVCMICFYGKHRGHDLRDVTEEADRERESLKMKLLNVNKHKDKLYDLPNKINRSMKELKDCATNNSVKIKFQFEQQEAKIKDEIKKWETERKKNMERIQTKKEKEINEIRRKYDEEMKQVKVKYEQEVKGADKTHNRIITELETNFVKLDFNFKKIMAEIGDKEKQNEIKLQDILEHCEEITERYESFTATSSSILASNDKWTEALCIPDIRAASEFLIEEMKKDFPELALLSSFKINDLGNFLQVDAVKIIERNDSVINVEGIQTKRLNIYSVTNVSDDIKVISGYASDDYSHITLINRDGKILRQDKIKQEDSCHAYRCCCMLSDFKLATVSQPYEVGIYDVHDGFYESKNIDYLIPNGEMVWCVTTDLSKNRIIVGTTYNEVHFFDNQLNYIKTIKLPDVARYQLDISVHKDNLLVCSDTGSAYEVTLEGSSSHVVHEFTKPNFDGGSWTTFNVCTDKKGFIFMLWFSGSSLRQRRVLVQYSQDGRQILAQLPVDEACISMTTAMQDDAEILVVVTRDTGKLYTYTLI